MGTAENMNGRSARAESNARASFRVGYNLPRLRNRPVMRMMPMISVMVIIMPMASLGGGNKKQAKKYDAGDAQHAVSYLTVSRSSLTVAVELRIQHDIVTDYQCLKGFNRL